MNNDLLVARIIAKTNEYLDFPSVVGHETPFLDHLARDFRATGLSVHRERNLTVVDTGRPGPVVCAHVDRHGAIIDTDGRARFAAYAVKSDKYREAVSPSPEFAARLNERFRGELMFAYDRRTGGRIAYGEVTAVALEPETGRLIFDFADMPPLPGGTPIAFARQLATERAGHISGQLDNPLSAAILRVLIEAGLSGTLVFAAEEEIGRSAAHILSWLSREIGETDRVLVLDTTPFDDMAAIEAGTVVLRERDANGVFHPAMTARAELAASQLGFPTLYKDRFIAEGNEMLRAEGKPEKGLGMTELGRIVSLSGGAVTGTTLQIPTVGYHTNHETTSRLALIHVSRTLLQIARAFTPA